jgi:Ca2+-binding RTX toxin-like protein
MSQVGTDAAEVISATDDIVYALNGDDRIFTSRVFTEIYGGNGDDFIVNSSTGTLWAYGGSAQDTLHGGDIADRLYGENGNDLLVGGEFSYSIANTTGEITQWDAATGDDYLDGGEGIDALYGLDGNDVLIGGDGDDSNVYTLYAPGNTLGDTFAGTKCGLYGGSGNDFLDGGRGIDYLDGGTGDDTMVGGVGNDTFVVDSVADVVVEGGGGGTLDIVITSGGYALGSNTDVERLTTNDINANINFNLIGNEIGQEIWGNGGRNRIAGNGGVDILKGYGGNDTFIFANITHSNPGAYDFIQDFEDYGDDDTIDLSGFAGTLSFIGAGAFTGLNQVRAYQSGSHVIVQLNTIGTTTPDGHFVLTNTTLANVTASDFIL